MQNTKRKFIKATALGAVYLASVSSMALAQDSVRIGVLLPLSGGSAAIGNQTRVGAEIAAAQINAAGGLDALGGAQVELIFADSQSKPDIGVSETERLIQRENVAMLIGAYNSAVTFPASEVAERYGVPWLVSGSVKNEITQRGFKYIFRPNNMATYDAREQVDAIDLLVQETGNKPASIGLFYQGDDWGRSHAAAVKQIAEERGYVISLDEAYVPNQVDFSSQLLKIRSSGAEALIFVGGTADHMLFNRQAAGSRLNLPFGQHSVGGGAEDPNFYAQLPESTYAYMFTQEDWQVDRMKSDQIGSEVVSANAAFEAEMGYPFNAYGAQGYSNIYIAADALGRAGSTERDAIRDALAATDITEGPALIMGYQRVSFDEHGQNVDAHGVISQNLGGERLTVWPAENRLPSTAAVWPIPDWSGR